MEIFNQPANRFIKRILVVASVIISGLCWYFSTGLNGGFWYLLWLAPIPVLIISFNAKAKTTFFISFLAYLIGRLSWFSYLVTVATIIPAIIFTITLPLIFALIILITRRTVLTINTWYSIFAFPVFFTTFEFLLITFSPDGTAGSIAYSQLNFLPVVQIASITGVLGITFMVTFFPSVVAVGWHLRKQRNKLMPLIWVSLILLITVFTFGITRISRNTEAPAVTVGLAVLEEKTHQMGNNINFQNELQHIKNYAVEINKLAARGAKLVVLPERAINIDRTIDSSAIGILSEAAKQNHIFIVTGYTNLKNKTERNAALVINEEGNVVLDYNKVHLVTGLESQFTPGNKIGLFKFDDVQCGTAICKDLDFPGYIKNYGKSNSIFVCVPAWDFVVDDWLHSRMAVLRGVENGFSEIRTARLGRLTISDNTGKVTSESNCSNGKATSLIGKVRLENTNTFYRRFGDWFGIMNAAAAILLLFILFIKRSKKEQHSLK